MPATAFSKYIGSKKKRVVKDKKKSVLAYTYVAINGCYGYAELLDGVPKTVKNKTHAVVCYLRFPVSCKTVEYHKSINSTLRIGSLKPLPDKKLFTDYCKHTPQEEDPTPPEEAVTYTKDAKTASKYLTYLLAKYDYMYLTRGIDFGTILRRCNSIEAALFIFLAKDVLPPEYPCSDCVLLELVVNGDITYNIVLSNITKLLDVDGDEFKNIVQTPRAVKALVNAIFSAAVEFPTEKKKEPIKFHKEAAAKKSRHSYSATVSGNSVTVGIATSVNVDGTIFYTPT